MSIPDEIIELARLIADAKAAQIKGFDQVIELEIPEAERIIHLWNAMQDDGK